MLSTDKPGQLAERERIVREWALSGAVSDVRESEGDEERSAEGGMGAALAARLVGVLESVERLPVLAPAPDAPAHQPAALHHLTKRIR